MGPHASPKLTCCCLLRSVSPQPQMQKQFAIQFCTTSYRTEMEAKHCLEKIFSGTFPQRGVCEALRASSWAIMRQPHGSSGCS